jgi:hypothetical protein
MAKWKQFLHLPSVLSTLITFLSLSSLTRGPSAQMYGPPEAFSERPPAWILILIVLGILLVFIVFGFAVLKLFDWYKHKQKPEAKKPQAPKK